MFGKEPILECSTFSVNTNNFDEDEDLSTSDSEELKFEAFTPRLSKHFRCASHTLNLLATVDFNSILKDMNDINSIHKSCFNR